MEERLLHNSLLQLISSYLYPPSVRSSDIIMHGSSLNLASPPMSNGGRREDLLLADTPHSSEPQSLFYSWYSILSVACQLQLLTQLSTQLAEIWIKVLTGLDYDYGLEKEQLGSDIASFQAPWKLPQISEWGAMLIYDEVSQYLIVFYCCTF